MEEKSILFDSSFKRETSSLLELLEFVCVATNSTEEDTESGILLNTSTFLHTGICSSFKEFFKYQILLAFFLEELCSAGNTIMHRNDKIG